MSENFLGKVPPHSIEAEHTLLGSILIDREALEVAINKLKGDYFYYDGNKEIFEAAKKLSYDNMPVDLLTITEELKKRNKLEQVGGVEYLAGLAENVYSTKNAKAYCKIIEEKAITRSVIKAANEILSKGYQDEEEVKSLIELAEKRIFDISQQREKRDFSHMKDIVLDVFNLLEERASHDGSMTGLTTGFEDIDRMTAGLQKSDFILIAARPSMGKTAFALNLALNAAVRDSANVAIFSLEMAKEQLVQRIVSMESLVESNKLRSGELEGDDWDKITRASSRISEANIYIDDTPGITLFEVQSKCRRLSAQNGLDLVVIDYLQLMEGEGKSESRQQEISSLSRGLKGLAREMSCPVISLSQLSRAPEQRQDHRPILSDLRESGAIEQDADVVMFLYRDEYYHEDSEKRGIAEVKIAKHRNGPTGTVELAWVERFTKFANRPK
ncbi:MAG: replicative DNA helicase [Tissierellales bacterium]|jgi:replicative DNA helicase|nr:replicative DNA helicase [Tissierellales bacterium]HCX04936.1 replicative DNA helicase [Clostridiales bacterium]